VPFSCPCRRRGLGGRQCCCHVSGAVVAMAHSRYLEALTKRPAMVAVGVGEQEKGMQRKEGGREAAARRRQAARRGGEVEGEGRMDDGRGLGGFEVASRAAPSPSPRPLSKQRRDPLTPTWTACPSPTSRPVPDHHRHHHHRQHLRTLPPGGDVLPDHVPPPLYHGL
jgi:hypothetical protein